MHFDGEPPAEAASLTRGRLDGHHRLAICWPVDLASMSMEDAGADDDVNNCTWK